jgi:hypothetical protein
MVALFFEVYGALWVFALIVFLVWASMAKLRPDLDEEELDLAELEKLKKLGSSEQPGGAIQPPIIEEPSLSTPARPAKHSKRPFRRHPHLFHTRKSHTTF